MINTQLGRRNLPPAQRLAVIGKFRKKIQEQAANKKSKDIAESNKRRSSNVLQMEKNEDESRKIHTDKEIAKMAGVGTGTVARYEIKNIANVQQSTLNNQDAKWLLVKKLTMMDEFKEKKRKVDL